MATNQSKPYFVGSLAGAAATLRGEPSPFEEPIVAEKEAVGASAGSKVKGLQLCCRKAFHQLCMGDGRDSIECTDGRRV